MLTLSTHSVVALNESLSKCGEIETFFFLVMSEIYRGSASYWSVGHGSESSNSCTCTSIRSKEYTAGNASHRE